MSETKHGGKLLFPPWVIDMMHEYNIREAKRNLEAYAHFLEEMRMSETKHDVQKVEEPVTELEEEWQATLKVMSHKDFVDLMTWVWSDNE